MVGVTVSKFWRPDVTHVIASTDENGACTRTLKVLMAISSGKWVLKLNCELIVLFSLYPWASFFFSFVLFVLVKFNYYPKIDMQA